MTSSLAGSEVENSFVCEAAKPMAGAAPPLARLKVLTLSCVYPNPIEPGLGPFIQRRLQHLAEFVDLEVVAPFPVIQYGGARGKRLRLGSGLGASERLDGTVRVRHPRWLYPPMAGSLNAFALFLQLVGPVSRICRATGFQVLDTHFGHPDGVAGALLSLFLRFPFTMTLRGNEPMHGRRGIGRAGMAWALRRASRVFTVSERLRSFAIEMGAPPSRVKTIPNGIDATIFYPRSQAACRAKFGFDPSRPLILSAGALIERKGHHRLIEAIAGLPKESARPMLAIAGGPGAEGQFEARLRSLVAERKLEDSVRFLGPVPAESIAELMCAADLFCLASSREGWPNVVHEALACGTPAVATDVGAVPDMLADKRCGIVVPVDDERALSRAISRALGESWDRAAIASIGQARSWRQVACEVYEELQQVVSERTKGKG